VRPPLSLTEGGTDVIVLEKVQLSLVCELDQTDVVGSTQVDELLGASIRGALHEV
jgi:hypothetical protein